MPILSDTEIPYYGAINENPNMAGVIDAQINEHLNQIEFQREFKEQYTTLSPLGFNIFKSYNYLDIPMEITDDFLEYVHVHIIAIPDYDISSLGNSKIEFLVRALYEILLIDIPNKMQQLFLETNPETIRNMLISEYSLYLDILKIDQSKSWEKLKAHFALDLFDSDLESFTERYIIPIHNKDI